jgi:LDH2 family malate/lactate/ureidoglycolate dehydrogenase
MAEIIAVDVKELRDCCARALARVGVPEDHIKMTLDVLVTADLQGIDTHGTRRLLPYIMRIRAGLINPTPRISVSKPASAVRIVEGDNGLGPVVAMVGLQEALGAAEATGCAFAGCRNSNHFGPGAPYALRACDEGMICVGGTNAFPTIAPWGGKDTIVGNNPLFIGVPRKRNPHFILDMAMSVVARGKMRRAADRGEKIPEGWALDRTGKPTTDPLQGLKGYVLPIGGHKGYGLALAIDLLAGVLTGSGFGTDVLSLFQHWDKSQRVGHFFICINPSIILPLNQFQTRTEALIEQVKGSSPLNPNSPILVPGEIEANETVRKEREGIPMDIQTWNALIDLSEGKYDGVTVSSF